MTVESKKRSIGDQPLYPHGPMFGEAPDLGAHTLMGGEPRTAEFFSGSSGITLRQHYAALFMVQISKSVAKNNASEWGWDQISRQAVMAADALITQLEGGC